MTAQALLFAAWFKDNCKRKLLFVALNGFSIMVAHNRSLSPISLSQHQSPQKPLSFSESNCWGFTPEEVTPELVPVMIRAPCFGWASGAQVIITELSPGKSLWRYEWTVTVPIIRELVRHERYECGETFGFDYFYICLTTATGAPA